MVILNTVKCKLNLMISVFNRTVEPPVIAVQALVDTLQQTRDIEEVLRNSRKQQASQEG